MDGNELIGIRWSREYGRRVIRKDGVTELRRGGERMKGKEKRKKKKDRKEGYDIVANTWGLECKGDGDDVQER